MVAKRRPKSYNVKHNKRCPNCHSVRMVKMGKAKWNGKQKQRWTCKKCHYITVNPD